jgi:two-component sensor histidine kinase
VLPITGKNGEFEGTLHIAIEIDWLTFVNKRQQKLPPGSIFALFDKTGAIVASNAPAIAATIFAGSTKSTLRDEEMRTVLGPDNEPWSLVLAPVLQHDHYVGVAMRDSDLSRLSYASIAIDLLLPVLMIALAALAIWWGTNRHILRWTDMLREMTVAYAAGNFALRPGTFDTAPDEFRELGGTLTGMALAVEQRDQSLKQALEQKELLIKEIHHRVKNTLQIVMSLLRLQSNRLRDPATREVLDQARARINALALAHRAIYDLDLRGSVDFKPLLSDAVNQVQRDHDASHTHLTVSLEAASCQVSGDTAIPLLLFVNEALTNAYNHGYPEPNEGGHISVSLKPACNGRMDLAIANGGESLDTGPDRQATGMGLSLMTALARQVSGEVSMQSSGGSGTVVTLNFPAITQAAAQC